MKRVERLMHVATKPARRIIGLMSGTSLDAIDAAMVHIKGHGADAEVKLEHFRSFPFPPKVRLAVRDLFDPKRARLDHPDPVVVYADVDWIDGPVETRSTFAIGQSAVIAERTGIITIGDLRVRDVAAGGHGAPLVPYFDWVLLRHRRKGRCIQNIGGIGNVTYIPPNAKWDGVFAFDTGPGNMIIDALAIIATKGRQEYDVDGALAASGTVDESLLERWLRDPYFERRPPKTTGRELFGAQFARRIVAESKKKPIEDLIATATALTAESIARAYRDFVEPRGPIHEVLLAGEAKEAMAMAMIANDSVYGMETNIAGATGGRPTILGEICL